MDDADSDADQGNYIWFQMVEDITCEPFSGDRLCLFVLLGDKAAKDFMSDIYQKRSEYK